MSICKATNQLILAGSRSQDEGTLACFIIVACQDRRHLSLSGNCSLKLAMIYG